MYMSHSYAFSSTARFFPVTNCLLTAHFVSLCLPSYYSYFVATYHNHHTAYTTINIIIVVVRRRRQHKKQSWGGSGRSSSSEKLVLRFDSKSRLESSC